MTTGTATPYPDGARERDRWILARRGPRNVVDADRPYAFFVEEEYDARGQVVPVATIFLTNRECPWRCVMCDLWRNTLPDETPAGAIVRQVEHALAQLPPARQVKLYNAGSFFDSRAIPPADRDALAERLRGFERVVVECHPALVGDACARFADRLGAALEVAMGLETAKEDVLARLNKRMTLAQYAAAADRLRDQGIALRSFVLVRPPFMAEAEAREWALRSCVFAFDLGATAVSLIPTRGGNGALDALADAGQFAPPALSTFEAAFADALALRRGRVFADLWDLERFSTCATCLPGRLARLRGMNLRQTVLPPIDCPSCGAPTC